MNIIKFLKMVGQFEGLRLHGSELNFLFYPL
jgi:hypothetical protein